MADFRGFCPCKLTAMEYKFYLCKLKVMERGFYGFSRIMRIGSWKNPLNTRFTACYATLPLCLCASV
ncbi:MAG: hypothetical protein FWG87_07750 [Defluviitaleaceae bacterium]|nr:hypothetical protein [Defluviitaleaceae bacterium]